MEIEPPDSLYGLYEGTPLTERAWAHGNSLPDRITIFQRPIEEDCEDEEEIRAVIGETLIHEVGHYFGHERGGNRSHRRALLARRYAGPGRRRTVTPRPGRTVRSGRRRPCPGHASDSASISWNRRG